MEVDSIIATHPAVKSRTQILGFSFIGGQGNTYGSFIVKLKDWDERTGKAMDASIVFCSAYDSGVQYQ